MQAQLKVEAAAAESWRKRCDEWKANAKAAIDKYGTVGKEHYERVLGQKVRRASLS